MRCIRVISINSMIESLASISEALEARSYREALSHTDAVNMLTAGASNQ